MSNAEFGKLYLFLGNYGKDKWHVDADYNNDGDVTSGEFCKFINESDWDTDTLGNRPDNDIIGQFFSKMLDENNLDAHTLDQAEINKVFEDEQNIFKLIAEFTASLIKGEAPTTPETEDTDSVTTDDNVSSTGGTQSSGGNGETKGPNGTFDGEVKWNNPSLFNRTVEEGSSVIINDVIGSASGVSFSASATGGLNVNCDSSTGKITLTAPDVAVDTNYTITLTATDEDGDTITKDITLTVNTDDEVQSTGGSQGTGGVDTNDNVGSAGGAGGAGGAQGAGGTQNSGGVSTDDSVGSAGGAGGAGGAQGAGASSGPGYIDGSVDWKAANKYSVSSGGSTVIQTVNTKNKATFSATASDGLRASCNSETGVINITAPYASYDETYLVTITAVDPDGDVIATKTITVTVLGDNSGVNTNDNTRS